jgi:hypothetical protein
MSTGMQKIESRHHFQKIRYCLDELVYSNFRKFPTVSFLHPVEQAKVQRKHAISFAKVYDKMKANTIKESDIQRTVQRHILLIMKANEMHYFSNLFYKVLCMFRTCPLSIIRSISTLYTRNRYLSF